jgi:hypothetical protein
MSNHKLNQTELTPTQEAHITEIKATRQYLKESHNFINIHTHALLGEQVEELLDVLENVMDEIDGLLLKEELK